MIQKIQSVLIFFIICGLIYIGFILEERRTVKEQELVDSDIKLTKDYLLMYYIADFNLLASADVI